MTEIVEFLRERLDEDERVLRAARPGPWVFNKGLTVGPRIGDDYLMVPTGGIAPCNDEIPEADARHIARHAPARVLREVEAKRAILAQEEEARAHYDHVKSSATYPVETSIGHVVALATVIRHLASVYSDHPDYREEWAV